MTIDNKETGQTWWYDFHNHKYRGPIPEARTKYEAEQAEAKLKRDVFEGKYGKQFGTMLFAGFVGNADAEDNSFGAGTFLEWRDYAQRLAPEHRQENAHPEAIMLPRTLVEFGRQLKDLRTVGSSLSRNGKSDAARRPLIMS